MTQKKIPSAVWILTGLAALALLGATIALGIRAATQSGLGAQVYLTSPVGLIHIHEDPSMYSGTVSVVTNGTPATVRGIEDIGGVTWYFVEVESISGWVDETRLSAEPPSR